MVVDGEELDYIASERSLSIHSVRSYIRLLYAHFGVSSREELMALILLPNATVA